MFWLADANGPRLNGSPGFEQAGDWAVKQLQAWGVSNPHKERWAFGKSWSLASFHTTMTAPQTMPIIGMPKAWSTSTNGVVSADVVRAMSPELFFDYLGVRLNGEAAEGKRLVVNWAFTDLARRFVTSLEHCALTWLADRHHADADATVTLERDVLTRLVLRDLSFADVLEQGLVSIDGDPARVVELFSLLDDFTLMFDVVEPRRAGAGPRA